MSSLEATEAASAAVAKTPNRVPLRKLEDIIAAECYFTLGEAQEALAAWKPKLHWQGRSVQMPTSHGAHFFTICAITTKSGFTVIGTTAPADPANFDAALGRTLAREHAVRQLWPLEGYLLRSKLAALQGSEGTL